MYRRKTCSFSNFPAEIQKLESRRLLSAAQVTPMQTSADAAESESTPKIATDGQGDDIIVWQNNGQSGSSSGIVAQQIDTAKSITGSVFVVSSTTSQNQFSVAMNSSGEFVIAWITEDQNGIGSSINLQRYSLDGAALGNEITIQGAGNESVNSPSVAIDSKGDVVVAWVSEISAASDEKVEVQRFDTTGAETGTVMTVGEDSAQHQPSIAMDSAGEFVVVWQSIGSGGNAQGIDAQVFSSSGTPLAIASVITQLNSSLPSVAMDSVGDFVVAWESGNSGQTTIQAQRYNLELTPQGGSINVSGTASQSNIAPTVAMDANGNFVVAWTGIVPGSSTSVVFAQQYDSSGVSQGNPEQFSASSDSNQSSPTVVMQSNGTFLVAWNNPSPQSNNSSVLLQQSGQSSTTQPAQVVPVGTPGQVLPVVPINQYWDGEYGNSFDNSMMLSNSLNAEFDAQLNANVLFWFMPGLNPFYALSWQQIEFEFAW